MENKQKIDKRPWWMINGMREPLGDIERDWIDAERMRWGFVEVHESESQDDEANVLSNRE